LPPGHSLWVGRDGNKTMKRFFDLRSILGRDKKPLSDQYKSEEIRRIMSDTVRHHLVADVPVGVFLSAGLDSATVTALASEISGASLDTITLSFNEFSGSHLDEAPLAEEIADLYSTRHQTRKVIGMDFHADLDKLLFAMDQPSIDGVNTYFVAKEASAMGLKVALSGLGGDEMFGGYESFRQISTLVGVLGWVPGICTLGKAFRIIAAPIAKRITSPKYAALFEYSASYGSAYFLRRGLFMPWELPEILDPDLVREGWRKLDLMVELNNTVKGISRPLSKVAALELSWYMRNQLLRDADWAGMAHSLEIRTPLVDATLFRQITGLGADKQTMARSPAMPLPASVLNRPKSGFSIPVREWLANENENGVLGRGLRNWARLIYNRAVVS